MYNKNLINLSVTIFAQAAACEFEYRIRHRRAAAMVVHRETPEQEAWRTARRCVVCRRVIPPFTAAHYYQVCRDHAYMVNQRGPAAEGKGKGKDKGKDKGQKGNKGKGKDKGKDKGQKGNKGKDKGGQKGKDKGQGYSYIVEDWSLSEDMMDEEMEEEVEEVEEEEVDWRTALGLPSLEEEESP